MNGSQRPFKFETKNPAPVYAPAQTPTDNKYTAILPPQLQIPWEILCVQEKNPISFIAKHKKGKFCKTNNKTITKNSTAISALTKTCHCLLQQIYRENTLSGSLPKRNLHHSCGHYTAFHITPQHPVANPNLVRIWQQPLQYDPQRQFQETPRISQKEQPLFADFTRNHSGQKRPTQTSPQLRTDKRVPLYPTRKNTRFRISRPSPINHFPSSPLPIVTTSHRHHLPSVSFPHCASLPHH